MVGDAAKEADVIKEKKLLEVKEKFLNKKSELEKRYSSEIRKFFKLKINLNSVSWA